MNVVPVHDFVQMSFRTIGWDGKVIQAKFGGSQIVKRERSRGFEDPRHRIPGGEASIPEPVRATVDGGMKFLEVGGLPG
jgi:hypothetical protein